MCVCVCVCVCVRKKASKDLQSALNDKATATATDEKKFDIGVSQFQQVILFFRKIE